MTSVSVPARTKQRRIAPGPRGNFITGNLAGYMRDPIGMLLQLQQQYGDVARNRLGPFMTHAIAHPKDVQYVLQENQRNYSRGRFYDKFKPFFGDGLLTTEGDFWRRHRRVVQPLFHKKYVMESTAVVGEASMALVERWRRLPAGEAIEIVEEMMEMSMHMLGLMVFGTDLSRHAKEVSPLVRHVLDAMMAQGNLNDFIPRWAPTPFNLRIMRTRKGLDRIMAKVMDEHRAGHGENSDLISLLLAARHPDTKEPMTETEVHDEIMTVFLAGHETTGSGLAWGLYALAQHPAVFRRLREELDARLGGRAPAIDELESLPYLNQVTNEILRVYPPIWGYPRDVVEDDEIGGYHIPAGSSIILSPYVTHRHPEFWSNPEAFDPDNFAPDAPKRHQFAYFPFGGGMRKCIGFQTALLQMRVFLAVVAQHLDFNVLPGHPIVRGALISLRPLQGIRLVIKPRQYKAAGVSKEAKTLFATKPNDSPTDSRHLESSSGCPFGAHVEMSTSASETAPAAAIAPPVEARHPPLALPSARPAASQADKVPTWRFTWFASEIEALPPTPDAALAGKRIAIVNGHSESTERLYAALAAAGAKPYVYAPVDGDDPVAAAQAVLQHAGALDGIIDLGIEAGFTLDTVDAWEAPIRKSVILLQACYDDWLSEEDPSRLFYLAVTRMDGRMGYGEDRSAHPASPAHTSCEQPLGGLWAGLAKTLPQEIPNCNVRILDLAPDEVHNTEARIISELYRWGLFEVGYHAGRRYTLQGQREVLPDAAISGLGPGDVVLLSGGARGIGLLCAEAIAEHYRATVIVTGREIPADGSQAWMSLDDVAFKRYSHEQLRASTPQRPPAVIRQELARQQRRRELRATLDRFAANKLPIEYRICDITDPAAVTALCDEYGDALRIVIHNAGVDRPVRLALKTADSFIDTVRTKVNGFANLWSATAHRPRLLQFCNVGSLTGRWGGMPGETDYAAANEALARLGLWAQHQTPGCVVKTVVWPTWEGVGMITNFDVTKRYGTPMAVQEGIQHWLRELADRHSGEVMFMGAVGRALTPIKIKGFSPIFELPNIDYLATRLHYLGTPQRFRPFARFANRCRIHADHAPFLSAFHLDGCKALLPTMLIEHACAVGAWVAPEGFKSLELTAITSIDVSLDALILQGSTARELELASQAEGYWVGSNWHVDVQCRRMDTGQQLLALSLVLGEAGASALETLSSWPFSRQVQQESLRLPQRAAWNEHLLRGAQWSVHVDAFGHTLHVSRPRAAQAADLWALPFPPQLLLPVNHIENAFRRVWAEHAITEEGALRTLRIDCMTIGDISPMQADGLVRHPDGSYSVVDELGQCVLTLSGVTLSSVTCPIGRELNAVIK